jgi:AcrR family transcriptional regulator
MKDSGAKQRILDAAETLFAEKGFHATSLRDITADANVNLAAVNYYFGSKEALLDAVLERRIAPINTARLQMLKSVRTRAGGEGPNLATVLRAYLLPPFREVGLFGEQGAKFMQLMGRMHSETHDDLRRRFVHHFDLVLNEFTHAFQQALPELSMEEIRRRMHFVIGAMAHTLVWGDLEQREVSDPEQLLERLVEFCEAGMGAPLRDKSLMEVGA